LRALHCQQWWTHASHGPWQLLLQWASTGETAATGCRQPACDGIACVQVHTQWEEAAAAILTVVMCSPTTSCISESGMGHTVWVVLTAMPACIKRACCNTAPHGSMHSPPTTSDDGSTSAMLPVACKRNSSSCHCNGICHVLPLLMF
jgi:hypothetical protein